MGLLNGFFGFLGGFNALFWLILGAGALFLLNNGGTAT
jgi:hypothetical protein